MTEDTSFVVDVVGCGGSGGVSGHGGSVSGGFGAIVEGEIVSMDLKSIEDGRRDGENNLAWPFWGEEKGRRARLLDGKMWRAEIRSVDNGR